MASRAAWVYLVSALCFPTFSHLGTCSPNSRPLIHGLHKAAHWHTAYNNLVPQEDKPAGICIVLLTRYGLRP